jgi:AcrR family transcriptional regulator
MAAKTDSADDALPRRRFAVDVRREQLLAVGMKFFSTQSYDEVWIEQIAEAAGVSRGLLYHYFPNKRDFYVEVTRVAVEEAGELTEPDPTLSPSDRLQAGIDAFLRYAEEHSQGFLTAYRGSVAGDVEVRAIVERARQRQTARILAAVSGEGEAPPLLRQAIRGWIALAQNMTAEWLQQQEVTRAVMTEMLSRTLAGVIAAAGQADPDVARALAGEIRGTGLPGERSRVVGSRKVR